MLIGISQILNNETFYRMGFPTCPMSPDNEIDSLPSHLMYTPGGAVFVNPDTVAPKVPVE